MMSNSICDILNSEVDNALQQAEKLRNGLLRRVTIVSDRIRQRQALARAEVLTPTFRVDLLKRAKLIQRHRSRLLQTLLQQANVLQDGDLRETYIKNNNNNNLNVNSSGTNLECVLNILREALRAEEFLTCWRQQLPHRKEDWCKVCECAIRVAREGESTIISTTRGNFRNDTAAQILATSEKQKQHQELDMLLEQLLSSCDVRNINNKISEEEEEAIAVEAEKKKEEILPWVSLPCICSISQYCCHAQLLVESTGKNSVKNNENTKSNTSEFDFMNYDNNKNINNDELDTGEKGFSSDIPITQMILHITTTHLNRLSEEINNNNSNNKDDEDDIAVEAEEELRLRVSIEVAARVTAYKHAIDSLTTGGEDAILFDGIAEIPTSTWYFSSLPYTPPTNTLTTLVLPPMEQLFFCIAYTIGIAILRDEQNEHRLATRMNHSKTHNNNIENFCDNEEVEEELTEENSGGWKGVLEQWILQEQECNENSHNTNSFIGPRLLKYLLEYVFHPISNSTKREKGIKTAAVRPERLRRWLSLTLKDTPEKDATIEEMMKCFMSQH